MTILLQIERVTKKNTQLQGMIDEMNKKINNPTYLQKVPEKTRVENAEKLQKYESEKQANDASISDWQKFL